MQVTGLDVYRAYCQALMASPHTNDELAAILYIPCNWEDEPEPIETLFEDMASAINAVRQPIADALLHGEF